jgi:hypothetical protein
MLTSSTVGINVVLVIGFGVECIDGSDTGFHVGCEDGVATGLATGFHVGCEDGVDTGLVTGFHVGVNVGPLTGGVLACTGAAFGTPTGAPGVAEHLAGGDDDKSQIDC